MLSVVDVQIYSQVFIFDVMELKVQSDVKKLLGGILPSSDRTFGDSGNSSSDSSNSSSSSTSSSSECSRKLRQCESNVTDVAALFLLCLVHLGS